MGHWGSSGAKSGHWLRLMGVVAAHLTPACGGLGFKSESVRHPGHGLAESAAGHCALQTGVRLHASRGQHARRAQRRKPRADSQAGERRGGQCRGTCGSEPVASLVPDTGPSPRPSPSSGLFPLPSSFWPQLIARPSGAFADHPVVTVSRAPRIPHFLPQPFATFAPHIRTCPRFTCLFTCIFKNLFFPTKM